MLIIGWVGLCTFWNPVSLFNELSCEAGSFSRCCNPHRYLQSEVWGFISLPWNPGLRWSVLLPSCSSWFICMQCWIAHSAAAALPGVLPAPDFVSVPPASQNECFFFNSLVVGLPYSLIFCSSGYICCLIWLCEEGKCICLHLHLGWKSIFIEFLKG